MRSNHDFNGLQVVFPTRMGDFYTFHAYTQLWRAIQTNARQVILFPSTHSKLLYSKKLTWTHCSQSWTSFKLFHARLDYIQISLVPTVNRYHPGLAQEARNNPQPPFATASILVGLVWKDFTVELLFKKHTSRYTSSARILWKWFAIQSRTKPEVRKNFLKIQENIHKFNNEKFLLGLLSDIRLSSPMSKVGRVARWQGASFIGKKLTPLCTRHVGSSCFFHVTFIEIEVSTSLDKSGSRSWTLQV